MNLLQKIKTLIRLLKYLDLLPKLMVYTEKMSQWPPKIAEELEKIRQLLATKIAEEKLPPPPEKTASTPFPQSPPIAPWQPLWDPSVQICLNDLIKPGDIVFDIGANVGGFTVPMSRLVGLEGQVYAFEASPVTFNSLQRRINACACGNVMAINRAVCATSGRVLDFYTSPGGAQSDSLHKHSDGLMQMKVQSLSLDDFCRTLNVEPRVIKMDIEGAEYEGLEGAKALLQKARPHLILEFFIGVEQSRRCLDFLVSFGYSAFCCATYRRIESALALKECKEEIMNICFIHSSRLADTLYCHEPVLVKTTNFEWNKNAEGQESFYLSPPVSVAASRYFFDLHLDVTNSEAIATVGFMTMNGFILTHSTGQLRRIHSYGSQSVFEVPYATEIRFFVKSANDCALCNLFERIEGSLSVISNYPQSPIARMLL